MAKKTFVTAFSTQSECGDEHLYLFQSEEPMTEDQAIWHLKENSDYLYDDLLYENLVLHKCYEVKDVPKAVPLQSDPKPEVETL